MASTRLGKRDRRPETTHEPFNIGTEPTVQYCTVRGNRIRARLLFFPVRYLRSINYIVQSIEHHKWSILTGCSCQNFTFLLQAFYPVHQYPVNGRGNSSYGERYLLGGKLLSMVRGGIQCPHSPKPKFLKRQPIYLVIPLIKAHTGCSI